MTTTKVKVMKSKLKMDKMVMTNNEGEDDDEYEMIEKMIMKMKLIREHSISSVWFCKAHKHVQ